MDYEWPETFPEGVPPDEAQEAEGNVFRVAKNLPPLQDDFKQFREEEYNIGKIFEDKYLIISYGVSFFKKIEDAKKLKKRYPNRLSDRYIVTGSLVPELGKILKTGRRSHHTIWFQKDAKPQEHINNEPA